MIDYAGADGGTRTRNYASIRQHVLIRFGTWHEIVAQELPADRDLYCNTTAMIHYAKGVAHAALGEVPAAEAEQVLFREAAKRVPKSRFLHNVPCGASGEAGAFQPVEDRPG